MVRSSIVALTIGCVALLSIDLEAHTRAGRHTFDIVATVSRDVITPPQAAAMVAEVNRIWLRAAVRVIWTNGPLLLPSSALNVSVYIDDRLRLPCPEDVQPLGAVTRIDGEIQPAIFVSRSAIHRLMESAGVRRVGDPFDFLYGRLVGRVVAHELGHLLLESDEHRSFGLMRPRFRTSDVTTSDTQPFGIHGNDLAMIRRQLTAQTLLARARRDRSPAR